MPVHDQTLQAIFVHCPHLHFPHRVMKRVFHHIDVWTSTLQPRFLPEVHGEFVYSMRLKGHGWHPISATTTAVIDAAQASAYLRVTLALTGSMASLAPVGPCSTVSSIPPFVLHVWCVVVATAIFMDRCSCRQKVLRRHSQRRFAEPLSTNDKKGAIRETSSGIQICGPHAFSGDALW